METADIRIDGARLMADLRALAAFGRCGPGVDRLALSDADIAARRWLADLMREAGLEARIDGYGTVEGRYPGVGHAVLTGSHTDTVPKGGWLDGSYGVIAGVAAARAMRAAGVSHIGLDVCSFQDEEGTFASFLGSKLAVGAIGPDDLADIRDASGRLLAERLAAAGFEGAPMRLDPARHRAFVELHIEQGPVLEAAGRRLGVVTGIVGVRRLKIRATGQADHAGTTPMALRRDAGAALIRLANRLLDGAAALAGPATVWNIGVLRLEPGGANVVPAAAELVFEFRDLDLAVIDAIEAMARREAAAAATEAVPIAVAPLAAQPPTPMAAMVRRVIDAAAAAEGVPTIALPSGAGHDAGVFGHHLPTGMIFVPSIGGRSHDVAEDTAEADLVLGAQVLARTVLALGAPAFVAAWSSSE